MNSNIATSTVLDLAADAVQMAGWTRGEGWVASVDNGGNAYGRLCLEGGIMAAAGYNFDISGHWDDFYSCPAYGAVRQYLDGRTPFSWNDKEDRTAEEVIEVLRAAAAVERVKEETEARILGGPRVYEQDDQPLPIEVAGVAA